MDLSGDGRDSRPDAGICLEMVEIVGLVEAWSRPRCQSFSTAFFFQLFFLPLHDVFSFIIMWPIF